LAPPFLKVEKGGKGKPKNYYDLAPPFLKVEKGGKGKPKS